MVTVIVKQREFYKLGYPYNSDVDVIFEKLTDEQKKLISDINLLNELYDFKNRLLEFDKKIINKINFVNKKIFEFNKNNENKIKEYENYYEMFIRNKNDYKKLSNELEQKKNDYDYYIKLKEKVQKEIEYIESLISDINSKLNFVSDINIKTLSVDIENRLNILNNAILDNDKIRQNFLDNLYGELTKYSLLMQKFINQYSEYCVVLHIHYNEWIKKYQYDYYKFLVDFFKKDYEACGTYGEHLLLENNLKEINNFDNKLNEMKYELLDINVRYDELVTELNVLKYISDNVNLINSEIEYIQMYKEQKIKNYNNILIDIKNKIDKLEKEIKMFVTDSEIELYNKYIDTANKIIRYVLINKDNIDENVISGYKEYLIENENKFKEIKKKMNDKDYLNKKILYEVSKKEYSRIKYYIELISLNKNVNIDSNENLIMLKEKLSEYLRSKEEKEEDIKKIDKIINDLNLDISILSDNLSKIDINIENLLKKINYLKNELIEILDKFLIEVYFNNSNDIYSNFKNIYINGFDALLYGDEINELKKLSYEKFALLYNKLLIDKLFDGHYEYYNNWLKETMTKYYFKQIKYSFYLEKYLNYLNKLMNEKLQEMFGIILKFLYSDKYDDKIVDRIKKEVEFIKKIFNELCDNKSDEFVIKYVSDLHDYTIISEIDECSDDIKNDFYVMLDMYVDYVEFINKKRLEIEKQQVSDNIIEKFWNNWS
jgi:hypothetical protein